MKTNQSIKRSRRLLFALGILLGASSVGISHAAVSLNQTVTFDGMTQLYRYSYSVTNDTALDLILLTIPTDSGAAVTSISPPLGFALTYDSSQAVISLFEDSDLFTNQTFSPSGTVAPFEFNSPLAPGSVTFTAFDTSGMEFSGTTLAPVPEPSASLLAGLSTVAVLTRRRRSLTH